MRFFWEQERDHCLLGLTVDNPVVIEELPKVRPRQAPEPGEHTEEVLDELGFDAAEIDALRANGRQ